MTPFPVFFSASFLFFLFFREKKRKNQRKETLTGWGWVEAIGQPSPFIRYPFFPAGLF